MKIDKLLGMQSLLHAVNFCGDDVDDAPSPTAPTPTTRHADPSLITPDFCVTIQGTADSNGLAHGHCIGVVQNPTQKTPGFRIQGEWQSGWPCGPCCIVPSLPLADKTSTHAFAIALKTEMPTASDYLKHPTRVCAHNHRTPTTHSTPVCPIPPWMRIQLTFASHFLRHLDCSGLLVA